MFLQPFVAYTTTKAVMLSVHSEMAANWKATDQKWTVPINVSIAKLSSFGPFPASYQAGVGFYAASPDDGPTWQLHSAIVVLLPRRRQSGKLASPAAPPDPLEQPVSILP